MGKIDELGEVHGGGDSRRTPADDGGHALGLGRREAGEGKRRGMSEGVSVAFLSSRVEHCSARGARHGGSAAWWRSVATVTTGKMTPRYYRLKLPVVPAKPNKARTCYFVWALKQVLTEKFREAHNKIRKLPTFLF